ncbi:MAG: hypothetical protein ACI4EK_05915 [Wujia sp.]
MKEKTQTVENKRKLNTFFVWFLSFLALTAIEVILLTTVSLIPRTAIQKHTQESADYFMQKTVFYRINDTNPASQIDHYADAILLNILYHFDSKHPISSSLTASYYYTDTHNENENLLTAVTSDVAPTYDYFRYWHGSTVLVRPLLTFLNIRQIYILFAVILTGLFALLFTLLLRIRKSFCAWSCLLALFSVSFWYIPMSLEYIWCFLIMLITGICVLMFYQKNKTVSGLFFLLAGNLTAYFDFLTTETLTLIFPLALLLMLMYDNHQLQSVKEGFLLIAGRSFCWGLGYISSWITKWVLTSIALGRNVFPEAISSASIRVNEEIGEVQGVSQAISAVARNISCLFPFNLAKTYSYAFAVCSFILLLMVYYLFRKMEKKKYMPMLFSALFVMPYIRFLTLANHSFLHYFFTYRAQFASIFCLCMIFYYGIDWKLVEKKLPKKLRFIAGSHNPSR